MMKQLKQIIIAILLIPLITLIFSKTCGVPPTYIERTDTLYLSDTIWQKDTFEIEKPVPKYIEIRKTDTVYTSNGDTLQLVTENKIYNDTLCNQNDSIILESSITGINPTLDYIKADWRKQEIINTVEITKYIKEKRKKFSIGTGIGYGLGLKNRDFEPFLGITLQYNF